MAGAPITVSSLISQVRGMLDEDNTVTISDTTDILPALNRAQDYAANILSRHYESPLLTYKAVTAVAGQSEYTIPEDAFEDRLEKIEVNNNGLYYPLTNVSYRDISEIESTVNSSVPSYYTVIGNRYRILPSSSGTYPFRVWYLRTPLPLVKEQGRVTLVDNASNFIRVDSVGTDLSTETDSLNSYVSIIDGQSGKRKCSLQVKTISGTKITFKSTPTRSTVQGLSIQSDLSSLTDSDGTSVSIEEDDYICLSSGSCIPFFKKPFSNFLVQYAIAELRRKLGEGSGIENQVLKELEDQVERSWVGRPQSLRVKRVNNNWNRLIRRFWRGN